MRIDIPPHENDGMSMTDETNRSHKPETDAPLAEAAANENDPLAAANAEKTELMAAVDELRDKYLRAVAEVENVRKRADREIAESRAYGTAALARDVLGIADNLTRALAAIDPKARATAEGTLKALLDGIDLTQRELQKALEKHGIRRLDPVGEKFDPNFHQAMFEVSDPNVAAGTIVDVMQTGYAAGDRVLRPALVALAKGGPKPASASAPEPTAPAPETEN
jgi:molecular chaperone GrpE